VKPLSHRVLLVEDNPDDLELARLANSYIVKPVDMEQFMSAVNSIGLYWLGLNLTDPHS
jgi:hypothetical protein